MLSRHFLVSIHHFPMGENAAEPFDRVRQAARVPLSCSIPQPADAENQSGKQRAALRSRNSAGTGLHTEAGQAADNLIAPRGAAYLRFT